MARKKDTPCAACGTLIWRPTKDQPPPGEAMCRECRGHSRQHDDVVGTEQGRPWHRRRGEDVCEPCRLAWNESCKIRRAAALGRGWKRRDRPEPVTRPSECSKCGKGIARTRLEAPMCAACRGVKPGVNIPISRTARLAIYERDDWTCGICLEPVDPTVNPNTAWGATLDHIVPRSQGGTHDPENLRLAHRWCNSARNDLRTYTDEDFRVA